MHVSLKLLQLKNFRGYVDVRIIFDEHMNVIIGKNDVGKSTILRVLNFVILTPISTICFFQLKYIGTEFRFVDLPVRSAVTYLRLFRCARSYGTQES